MEGISSLRGQTLTTVPASSFSLLRQGFHLQGRKDNHVVRFSTPSRLRSLDLSIRPSGPIKARAAAVEANPKRLDSKDKDIVFVAGATGKVGSRTVRELLKLGFRVRAGVRSSQRAQSLVQSVKEMKLENEARPVEKLEIVECDLEKTDSIQPAIGNASVVICCIGASEKEVFDITGPFRIDFLATKNLVDAAKVAKVDNFILVTSLGTNKFGFPAAVLNLFWGVLCWKRQAEEALIASGLPYTIVRPGGMERPTDAYKQTHNLSLSLEDTLFGGQVSNLQVAELLAFMAKNPQLSFCKIVEVIAETTQPLTPMEDLLKKIPSKRRYIPPPMESNATKEVEPAPSKIITQEEAKAPAEEEDAGDEENSMEAQARPLSPYAAYEDLKPPTSPLPSFTKTKEVISKTLDAVEVKEVEGQKLRPLSPYACYDDLKPPTSPSPSSTAGKLEDPRIPSARPLSPYAVYADLKPPTSPSPTASGPSPNDVAVTVKAAEEVVKSNSPFSVYDDLKPPASPSPTSPTLSSGTEPAQNDVPEPSSISSGGNAAPLEATSHDEPKPTKPLSPYAMYEDLKPPTSPVPSPATSH